MSDTLTATVDLLAGMTFRATSGTGHQVAMDAAPESGGADVGPRPIEMLLLGLGGCTGMDVISMLRKMLQDVTSYQVRLNGKRATEHPRMFTAISVEHVVRGRGLNADSVKRAVWLSATRYCSVDAMLRRSAHLDETYRIVDVASGQEQTGSLAMAA